jgi:hypothetical protein
LTRELFRNSFRLEQKPPIDHFRDEMITSATQHDSGSTPRNSRRVHLSLAAIVLVVIASTSCTNSYRRPQLTPPENEFSGIADAFKAADGSAVPEVDVLLVHGMGFHDSTWIPTMIQPLAVALGFDPAITLPAPEPLPNGAQLYQVTLHDSKRTLQIAAVIWSPITEGAKKALCYDINSATSLCTDKAEFTPYRRASLNGYIKSQIMDDRLSDVTFYLGKGGGELIREAIDDAWLRSLSTTHTTLAQVKTGMVPTAKSTPLFIISESLGSKIAIDSLEEIESLQSATEFAKDVRSHMHALYLLANQIPILNLGARDAAGRPDIYQHLKTFANKRSTHRRSKNLSDTPLHVVAFSDPSDVFSYVLPKEAVPREDAIISNVIISNDCTYFGVVENPANAHTKYIQNNPVANAIAHGSGTLANAKGVFCAK